MSNHTPGPWRLQEGYHYIIEAPSCDGFITRDVCRLDSSTMAAFAQQANARLIAAAPELFDLVSDMNNWLVCAAIATPEDMAQSFEAFQRQCAAMLAKVRGEA